MVRKSDISYATTTDIFTLEETFRQGDFSPIRHLKIELLDLVIQLKLLCTQIGISDKKF